MGRTAVEVVDPEGAPTTALAFEVRDGLITLWDDRFSWGEASVASVAGLLRLLRGAR